MPEETTTAKPIPDWARIILAVEGPDDEAFFRVCINKLQLKGIFVDVCGGIEKINPYLAALSIRTGFQNIEIIGVVRDSDLDSTASIWQKVRGGFERAGLPIPENLKQLSSVKQGRRSAVYIFERDSDLPGMLETICLQAFGAEKQFECIDSFFDCLAKKGLFYKEHSFKKLECKPFLPPNMKRNYVFKLQLRKVGFLGITNVSLFTKQNKCANLV